MSMYCNAELLDRLSLCTIFSVLLNTLMKLSASPFARGCSEVTLWCVNPISSANFWMSVELNGGPLSVSSLSGIPCVANIFLSLSYVVPHEVDVVCSTAGDLVRLTITTRLY